MQKKWIRLILAAIAVPVIATGAFHMVKAYEDGTAFQPVLSDRELQVNQVVFSGDEDTTSQKNNEEKEGESELWEKDRTAEDALSPELKNSADYLFQTGSSNLPNGAESINLAGDEAGNSSLLPGDETLGNGGYIYDITGDRDSADGVIAAGSGSSGGTGSGSGSGQGSSGASGAGTVRPTDPTTTPAPDPEPTTRPADTVRDPEPEKPIGDDAIFDTKIFDSEKVQEEIKNNPDKDIRVYIGESIWGTVSEKLYRGQTLNAKNIFAALEAWVSIGQTQYVWKMEDVVEDAENDAGKYVRIDSISFDYGQNWIQLKDFPVTVPLDADMVVIKASYRLSGKDEWIEYIPEWEEYISYSLETGRIYVLDHVLNQAETTISKDSILNDSFDQYAYNLNLYRIQERYFKKLYGIAATDKWQDSIWLDKIFTGWTENGEPVDWNYISTPGRHILEPGEMLPLGEEYGVQLQRFQVDYTDCYLQTLKTWYGFFYHHVKELKVPEGIQAIDMMDSAVVENMDIPESVLAINVDSFQVNNAYRVSEDNQQYTSSKEGLLLNKEETQILDVPTRTEVIVIPDTIQNVEMSEYNKVRKIIIQADSEEMIPTIDVTNLKNCEISVADELVEALYKKNDLEYDPKQNNRVTAGDKTYYLQNQLLYNDAGELRKVLSEGRKSVSLTNEIKSIDKDAFQGQEGLTTLILSQTNDNVELKEGCFEDSEIKVIQCYSETQMKNIKEQLQDSDGITVMALLQAETSGYWYTVEELNGTRRVTLVQAPENITIFDGKIKDAAGKELIISEIGENAFSKCKSLKWVTLPESVDTIGYEAFYGCSSLQGILIDAKDTITIGDQSMEGCPALRFVGSNAKNAERVNEYNPLITDAMGNLYFYCLDGSTGYGYNSVYFKTLETNVVQRYTLVDLDSSGESKMLYAANDTDGNWMALRSGSEMPKQAELPDTTIEIFNYAMAETNAEEGYSLNWSELKNLKYIDDGVFMDADLAGVICIGVAGSSYEIGQYAFWGCSQITEVQLHGDAIKMGTQLFQNCTELRKVSFEAFVGDAALQALTFRGCDNLETIQFSDGSGRLSLMEIGHPYYFDSQEDDYDIQLQVPEDQKEVYLEKWRYYFAGYVSGSDETDYQVMYNAVKKEMDGFDGDASDEEVKAEVNRLLLIAENRLRTMLGMATLDAPTDFDSYDTANVIESSISVTVSDGNAAPSVSDGNAAGSTQEETVK